MARTESIISLDPIDRKKQKGPLARLLVTRWYGGQSVHKSEKFGHYMFCGPQRSGKTSSALWYAEMLGKRYKRKKLTYKDHTKCNTTHINKKGKPTCKFSKFKEPAVVRLWSNFGVGRSFKKEELFKLIDEFDPYANEVRIILVDEIHGYFPRGGVNKKDQEIVNNLLITFSQLAKRNCYVLSTAQVYGRLDKALREQCLYMINCKVNIRGKLVNDFILGDDIIADELGRWAGDPKYVKVHGLSKLEYDTKRLIRE